jgi:CRP/FNR family transcriptional regulator, cyclic AMP receptor protein
MTERFSSNELAVLLERSAWFRAASADLRMQ